MRRRLVTAVLAIAGMLLLGTLSPTRSAGSSAAELTGPARDAFYVRSCVICHGDHGQGVPGKTQPLDGPVFQARNPTALIVFDIVRSARERNLAALTDDQVWATIAAELQHNGIDLGGTTLDATNAATVLTGPAARADRNRFFPPGR